jgi:hypothetical protein
MPNHQSLDRSEQGPLQRRQPKDAAPDSARASHPMLALQRHVGNAQIARMLAQRASEQDLPEVGLEGGPISDALAGRINAQRGSGVPLNETKRTQMESALGAPLDDVRIHHDTEADLLNRSISARAFTTGTDLFLSSQASPDDTDLMAHELTHVVQQRDMSASGPLTVGPAGDSYEQEADAVADAVAAGGSAQVQAEADASIGRDVFDWLKKASEGVRIGDYKVLPPTPKTSTDDRYDTPENRRRAEMQDENERGGGKYPSPLTDPKPADSYDPYQDPFLNPRRPQGPLPPLPAPEPPAPGDYPIPDEDDDQGYA